MTTRSCSYSSTSQVRCIFSSLGPRTDIRSPAAALMTYREDLSYLPAIDADTGLTRGQKADIRTAFLNAIRTYVTSMTPRYSLTPC